MRDVNANLKIVEAELAEPVDPRVTAMAAAIAARHADAASAVLFYGSCLRQRELEGLMLDFYLIVSSYRKAYGRGWLAFANRLIPPNVFHFEHQGLVAKYAVLSDEDFRREMSWKARSTSVWARFAQPARLVWVKADSNRWVIPELVAGAGVLLFNRTLPMMESRRDVAPIDVWKRGFELTYSAELRAERGARPDSIVDADRARYQRLGEAILDLMAGPDGQPELAWSAARTRRWWRRMRRKGKALTLLRLAKASTTFSGGIDYLAWKINRHAGTKIEIKPWQRRWPLVAALILLPRLLRRGAIR